MRNTTGVQWAAICGAAGLLILQIIGGLEYVEGGSTYTKWSMIASLITVALLPVFIEVARQARAYLIVTALGVAFVAFLAYTLPATIGRTSEVRETKAVEASASVGEVKRLEGELDRAQERLADAFLKADQECSSGFRQKCEGWRSVVAERQGRVDELTKEVNGVKPKLGDVGSEALAWSAAGFVSAESIRRLSSLSFGFGLDVVIWALVWFASSDKMRRELVAKNASNSDAEPLTERQQLVEPAVHNGGLSAIKPISPTPPKRKTKRQNKRDRHVAWVRKYREKHGRSPKLEVVSSVLRIPSTTAYRRMKQAAA
jgi:hypothetical protein